MIDVYRAHARALESATRWAELLPLGKAIQGLDVSEQEREWLWTKYSEKAQWIYSQCKSGWRLENQRRARQVFGGDREPEVQWA